MVIIPGKFGIQAKVEKLVDLQKENCNDIKVTYRRTSSKKGVNMIKPHWINSSKNYYKSKNKNTKSLSGPVYLKIYWGWGWGFPFSEGLKLVHFDVVLCMCSPASFLCHSWASFASDASRTSAAFLAQARLLLHCFHPQWVSAETREFAMWW